MYSRVTAEQNCASASSIAPSLCQHLLGFQSLAGCKGECPPSQSGRLSCQALAGKIAVTQDRLSIQEEPDLNLDAGQPLVELFTLSGFQFLYQ